jgi:hypothetical protein
LFFLYFQSAPFFVSELARDYADGAKRPADEDDDEDRPKKKAKR